VLQGGTAAANTANVTYVNGLSGVTVDAARALQGGTAAVDAANVAYVNGLSGVVVDVARRLTSTTPGDLAQNRAYVGATLGMYAHPAVDYTAHLAADLATVLPNQQLWVADNTAGGQGRTLQLNDRILLPLQSNPLENGVYDVLSGGAVRAGDMVVGMDVAGTTLFDRFSTRMIACTNRRDAATVGTWPLLFVWAI
jgi:hypothetical protein